MDCNLMIKVFSEMISAIISTMVTCGEKYLCWSMSMPIFLNRIGSWDREVRH